MAFNPDAVRLTEAHRVAQARLAQSTFTDMADLWPLLDPGALDATAGGWLRETVPLTIARQGESGRLARLYLYRYRALELPDEPVFVQPRVRLLPVDKVVGSLLSSGPAVVKARTRDGYPLDGAFQAGLINSGQQAETLVLSGGRNMVMDSMRSDPKSPGARRVTSANACAFCAMLATRDYYRLSSGSFPAHRGCKCSAEPAYDTATYRAGDRRGATRQAKEYAATYSEATEGVSSAGNGKLNAFRRALAAQRNG